MESLGETLRAAREAKGATASEAAEATKMKVQQIDALENEDYGKIAAPIYVKGFLKIYAEYLGLDPDQAIEHYKSNNAPLSPNELVGNRQEPKHVLPPRKKAKRKQDEEKEKPESDGPKSAFGEMLADLLKWIKSIRISGMFVRHALTVLGALLALLLIISSVRSCVERRGSRRDPEDFSDIELIEPVPEPFIEPEHMPRG